MTDQATLLRQLKIERNENAAAPRARRTVLVVGAAAVGIAAAAFAAVSLVGNPAEQLASGVAAAEEAVIFSGDAVSIGGGSGTLVTTLEITPATLLTGFFWACGVGFIGALFPAVRAARLPLATALRAA